MSCEGLMPTIPAPAPASSGIDLDEDPMVIGSTPVGGPFAAPPAPAPAPAGPLGAAFVPLPGFSDGPPASPIVELPGLSDGSFNLSDLDFGAVPDMLPMPSQDLIITDSELAKLNEQWNSEMHAPAGQAALPQRGGGGGQL